MKWKQENGIQNQPKYEDQFSKIGSLFVKILLYGIYLAIALAVVAVFIRK